MAAVSATELAPEALTGVRDAQAALQAEADRMAAVGDPLARSWAAMASAGKANHGLLVDVFLKTQKLLEDGRKPWTRDETRVLVQQLDQTLLYRWTQFNWAGIAIGVGVALLFGLVCGAGGWFARGDVPALAGVHAGAERCQDQAGGGRLCWIPVWERLPAK
jgi:hypothetical protein